MSEPRSLECRERPGDERRGNTSLSMRSDHARLHDPPVAAAVDGLVAREMPVAADADHAIALESHVRQVQAGAEGSEHVVPSKLVARNAAPMVGEGMVPSPSRLLGERRLPADDLDPDDRSHRRKGLEI